MAITKAISASVGFFAMIDSDSVTATGLAEPEVSAHEDIQLDDVSFAYPTRANVQVLKGFNARFLKGKTTALVGPSGSGKSTIVALLERWYELQTPEGLKSGETAGPLEAGESKTPQPSQSTELHSYGTISVGGVNINDTNVKWWRTQIGLVQQEPFLFNDTIFNNVAFGLLGTQWENAQPNEKRAKVEQACREAFADEFIQQLPDVRHHRYPLVL